MRRFLIPKFIVICLPALGGIGCTPQRPLDSGDRMVFTKDLPSGAKLRLVQGPSVPADICRSALPKSFIDVATIAPLRLELVPVGRVPIVLYSQSMCIRSGDAAADVLDMQPVGNYIVFIMAGSGIWVSAVDTQTGADHSYRLPSDEGLGDGGRVFSHDTYAAKIDNSDDRCAFTFTVTQLKDSHRRTVYGAVGMVPDVTFRIVSQDPPIDWLGSPPLEWLPPRTGDPAEKPASTEPGASVRWRVEPENVRAGRMIRGRS